MSNELTTAEEAIEKVAQGIAPTKEQAEKIMATLVFPAPEKYADADLVYNELHRAWSHGEDKRKELTGPLNEVIRKLNVIFKARLDPIEDLKRRLKRKMDDYATSEMNWKRDEQRKADAAARKKAEDEQLARAQDLEKHGNHKAADVVVNQPTVVPKTEVRGATDAGASTIKTMWKAEVVDAPAFLRAIAEGVIPMTCIEIKMPALDRIANASKGQMKFPGVEWKEVASVGARR